MSNDAAILEGVDGFNRLMGDIITFGGPGTNVEAVERNEIGHLIETCVSYTPMATQKNIRQRADYRFREKYGIRGAGDLKVTFNDGLGDGGRIGGDHVAENVWLRSGGKFYIMRGAGRWPSEGTFKRGPKKGQAKPSRFSPDGAHWPDRIWAEYQSLIDQTPEERAALKKKWTEQALLSQGLARKSWVEIARALGIPLQGIDEENLLAARTSSGLSITNGSGHKAQDREGTVYTLSNSQPILVRGDGEAILLRALGARSGEWEMAREKGLLTDIDYLKRRYSGLLAA